MPPKKIWKKKELLPLPLPPPPSAPSSSSKKQTKKVWRKKKETTRNWLELPRDVTASILHRLGAIEILESAQKVCMLWRSLCKDPSMWRAVDMRNSYCRRGLGDPINMRMRYSLEKMCIHAIDRSFGQLLDINIENFGSDELLSYIAQSSSQLRRLCLVCCDSISEKALREAAAKLPLLEELGMMLFLLPKESLEAVGHCCPLLKSLKWNQKWDAADKECDEEAVAIAKNMPELHHLQLIGNQLTNDGLQAILDGCPHLESLDLRRCFNVTLSGNLGRCAERIKNLQHPNDSMDGYEFIAEQSLYLSNDSTDDYEFVDDIHDDDGSFDDDSDDIHDEDGSFGDDYEFVADIHDDDGSSDEESDHIHDDDGSFDDDTNDIHDDDVSFDDDSDDIHDDDGSFDDDSNNIHDDDSDDESFDDDPDDDGSFDDDSNNNPIDSDDDDESFDDDPDDDESFDDDSDNDPIY